MSYLNSYLDYSEDLTFDELPFNEIDGVIFSLLPMLDCSISFPKRGKRSIFHCVARHVRVNGLNPLGLLIKSDMAKLLFRVSKSQRFGDLKVHDFSSIIDPTTETQATALTVDISPSLSVIVFSGTDDTIVGWKEDFNMMYTDIVPCLEHSLKYLTYTSQKLKKFYIVGHSKGGMEAFYAYCFARKDIQRKTIKVYSYDGPGFSNYVNSLIEEPCKRKLRLLVPHGGIVGRMFSPVVEPIIIYSSYHGLQQHDPLSWEINRGKLHFHRMHEFNVQSNLIKQKVDEILDNLPRNKQKEFVHYLFEVISAGGALTLTDMRKKPHLALKQYLKLPPNVRKLITSLILHLANDKIISRELLLGVIGINKKR